ncbi:alpha-amylase [Clostridium saccharoperbutylacetonicum]|uniref:alpha-amylase n=1 Tax=Clostridium saccharoperbutylacetonicum TaxID=36745 RepID=UPI000983C886|nr:alpha-amylase [Clostridium saccharoperbutylacetonicum]AQR94669.1 alpha-1,4-glucan:maltose-1-phosphate maltosyltransferase [Clostridium saccharoperbutylacetonicum]NSB30510.1 glycosidase [Clostridium saccharoperbutylacetonicum]
MKINNLSKIDKFVKSKISKDQYLVWIPKVWNTICFQNILCENENEIRVDAYEYISNLIQFLKSKNYNLPMDNNFDKSSIYCSLVRYSTAWDYNHDGKLEMGTFLKMIILLPMLKNIGIDILYLLPITEYSELYIKGDIGGPFAIKNYFKLDKNLHDDMLDDMYDFTLDDEFASLVEACHLLGIRVVNDFIPRVTARNSDIIKDHPDWVYWIKKEYINDFKVPNIPELGFFEECTHDNLETIYKSEETKIHLSKFSKSPDKLDSSLWKKLKEQSERTGEDLLLLVEKEMKITTPPAHSDWVNDVQPIWTDITFLKIYMDVYPEVKKFLSENQAPYVMFDTIKANKFPGREPNYGLWQLFEDVLRHNITKYDIDGIRVDIGHTLPQELLNHLFNVVKEIKPNAIFMSEDLFNRNHERAYESGYNIMLGSEWLEVSRISKDNLINFLTELRDMKIKVFGCAETADTPRIVTRNGGIQLARSIAVFNMFIPNAVPFITTGGEVNEDEPINCGLADNTNGAEIPRAFFNKMKIKWTNENAQAMLQLLKNLKECKSEYLSLLNSEYFEILSSSSEVIIYAYKNGRKALVLLFNLNMNNEKKIILNESINFIENPKIVINSVENDQRRVLNNESDMLKPGQAIVLVGDCKIN